MHNTHKVAVLSPEHPPVDLGATILWRKDIIREQIADIAAALQHVALAHPNLLVIDWPEQEAVLSLVQAIRARDAARGTGIVVVSRTMTAAAEGALITAGANVILPAPVNPLVWDKRLEQLLNAPPRRAARVAVRCALWSMNLSAGGPEFPGTSLNLSSNGMLITTGFLLDRGAKLDVRFTLPGQTREVNVVGQVVWSAPEPAGGFRSGIQLIVMREDAGDRIRDFLHSPKAGTAGGRRAPRRAGDKQREALDWERELRVSEARKLASLNASSDAIVSVDAEGHVLEFNTAAERTFGYARAEILGKPMTQTLVPVSLRERLHLEYRRIVADEEHLSETLRFTAAALRRDGSEFPARIAVTPMLVKGNLLFTFYLQDLTPLRRAAEERRLLETQLEQARRLESLGTLAGGIAHDFNNILSAIIGYSELALAELRGAAKPREDIREVLNAAFRARDMVGQILTFSRTDTVQRRRFPIHEVVGEAVKLVRATLPAGVAVRAEINERTGTVLADPSQLHQVVINLCTNARQAMGEGGGTLSVFLEPVTIDQKQAAQQAELKAGAYALLVVKDTGAGMDSATITKIFEPFFTTKEPGEGTGLGLAVVHGIVKGLEGAIFAESKPGKGTTFRVYIPLNTEGEETTAKELPKLSRGRERILFVDDEPGLASLGKRTLESLGYAVTAATSSREALELFRRDPAAFDLVITDQVMQGLTGAGLAVEIMDERPDVPVIICTGHTNGLDSRQAAELGVRAFVYKPLQRAKLAELVRAVLDG